MEEFDIKISTGTTPLNQELSADCQTSYQDETDTQYLPLDNLTEGATNSLHYGSQEDDDKENVISLKKKRIHGKDLDTDKKEKLKCLYNCLKENGIDDPSHKVFPFAEQSVLENVITLAQDQEYHEGHDYIVECKNIKRDVDVLKDKRTGNLHVRKRVDGRLFHQKNELDAIIDLEETGKVPHILIAIVTKGLVDLHLEYILPGFTVQDYARYADKFINRVSSQMHFVFSLYIYRESLQFLKDMFEKRWRHEDFNYQNIMIRLGLTLRLKFIDFGESEKATCKISMSDFMEAFRNFSGLVVGERVVSEHKMKRCDQKKYGIIYCKVKKIEKGNDVDVCCEDFNAFYEDISGIYIDELEHSNTTEEDMLQNIARVLQIYIKCPESIREQEDVTDEQSVETLYNEKAICDIRPTKTRNPVQE